MYVWLAKPRVGCRRPCCLLPVLVLALAWLRPLFTVSGAVGVLGLLGLMA